ncbi:MAG: iron-sulfur cluster assembly scaffold protein [Planctomycetaceae bacterium]|nr:iron-sulfur cluster assembly scaffold protein [Planctomycetaceae bacterium]
MQLFNDAVHGQPGTHLGEVADPDGLGEHGSIACGDALRFTFKVERNNSDPLKDVIVEAKYLTFGCTSAIAASEALCCLIETRHVTPVEALSITNQDIVDFLDGLPEQKIHCSVMGAEALQAAVFNWAQKRGVNLNALGIDINSEEREDGRVVCKCFTLTEPYIKRKIKELNLHSVAEITSAIKAGGACMTCHHAPGGLQDVLNDVWDKNNGNESTERSAGSGDDLLTVLPAHFAFERSESSLERSAERLSAGMQSPFQFAKKIEKLLDGYLRPMVQKDGGDLELVDIKDTTVYLELRGTCAGCAGAGQTLKYLVEKNLKEQVDERIRVIQV